LFFCKEVRSNLLLSSKSKNPFSVFFSDTESFCVALRCYFRFLNNLLFWSAFASNGILSSVNSTLPRMLLEVTVSETLFFLTETVLSQNVIFRYIGGSNFPPNAARKAWENLCDILSPYFYLLDSK
jgi:hypothetical protein